MGPDLVCTGHHKGLMKTVPNSAQHASYYMFQGAARLDYLTPVKYVVLAVLRITELCPHALNMHRRATFVTYLMD